VTGIKIIGPARSGGTGPEHQRAQTSTHPLNRPAQRTEPSGRLTLHVANGRCSRAMKNCTLVPFPASLSFFSPVLITQAFPLNYFLPGVFMRAPASKQEIEQLVLDQMLLVVQNIPPPL